MSDIFSFSSSKIPKRTVTFWLEKRFKIYSLKKQDTGLVYSFSKPADSSQLLLPYKEPGSLCEYTKHLHTLVVSVSLVWKLIPPNFKRVIETLQCWKLCRPCCRDMPTHLYPIIEVKAFYIREKNFKKIVFLGEWLILGILSLVDGFGKLLKVLSGFFHSCFSSCHLKVTFCSAVHFVGVGTLGNVSLKCSALLEPRLS